MLALLLMVQAADDAAMVRAALERTAAEQRCTPSGDTTDITVCGLRRADRYRVPFDTHALVRGDDVPARTAALLRTRTPVEEMGPFLVGGGMAGVHAGVGGSGVTAGGLRKLAP